MLTYTTLSGREIDYEEPGPELAAFLERVKRAQADPRTTPADLILLIYGPDNPILERGWVNRAAFENPVYHVMADLLGRKEIGDRVELVAAAHTMTPQEAADRLGLHVSAVRQAIDRGTLPAWRKGDRWYLDPRSVDSYKVSATGPKTAKKGPVGGELAVKLGVLIDGVYFKVKRPAELGEKLTRAGGNVHVGTIGEGWKRLGVLTSHLDKARFFVLEPAAHGGELAFDGFYIRGDFTIAAKENNAKRAREAWDAFLPE